MVDPLADLNLKEEWHRFVMEYTRIDVPRTLVMSYCIAYGLDYENDYDSASTSASRLLKNVKIAEAIARMRAHRVHNHEAMAEHVLRQWMETSMADPLEALNITGPIVMIKDISEIPVHMRSAIKSVETTANGIKLTLHDKSRALENIAKALGMFVEKKQTVSEDYESLIERVAKKKRSE